MRSPLHRMRAAAELLAASPESIANDPAALAKLLAEEGKKNTFGGSVALSVDGRTALIGKKHSGTPYVFIKEVDGSYSQQAKFEPDMEDSMAYLGFGCSVSLSADGRTVLIGDSGRSGKGAFYIFTKDEGGSWKKQALITADDGSLWQSFGWSVSLSADGQTALIGACEYPWMTSNISEYKPGSAYIFVRGTDGTWSQQVKLVPNERAKGDRFGSSVSLSADGQTALIGAEGFYCFPDTNDFRPYYPGAAYIFTKGADGAWSQQQIKIVAEDINTYKGFGCSVSLAADGQTALIGTRFHARYEDYGEAYAFTKGADGAWSQQATLTASPIEKEDGFGNAVSLSADGRVALIGASGDDDKANNSGAAYVFVKNENGRWSQRFKLTAEDGEAGDGFGDSVALSADGQTALIGAPSDDYDYRAENSGAVYVFSIPPLGSSAPVAAMRLRQ